MRLEITQKADLAVRALVVLSKTPQRLKSGDLASALDTTPGYVPQVMGPLVRAGWVGSEPGPSGGYLVPQPLDDLTVLEVIELIDGPTDNGRCVVANRACDGNRPCALHAAWAAARVELRNVLGNLTIVGVTER